MTRERSAALRPPLASAIAPLLSGSAAPVARSEGGMSFILALVVMVVLLEQHVAVTLGAREKHSSENTGRLPACPVDIDRNERPA